MPAGVNFVNGHNVDVEVLCDIERVGGAIECSNVEAGWTSWGSSDLSLEVFSLAGTVYTAQLVALTPAGVTALAFIAANWSAGDYVRELLPGPFELFIPTDAIQIVSYTPGSSVLDYTIDVAITTVMAPPACTTLPDFATAMAIIDGAYAGYVGAGVQPVGQVDRFAVHVLTQEYVGGVTRTVQFERVKTIDSDGNVQITDFTLDGLPYSPVGDVAICSSSFGTTTSCLTTYQLVGNWVDVDMSASASTVLGEVISDAIGAGLVTGGAVPGPRHVVAQRIPPTEAWVLGHRHTGSAAVTSVTVRLAFSVASDIGDDNAVVYVADAAGNPIAGAWSWSGPFSGTPIATGVDLLTTTSADVGGLWYATFTPTSGPIDLATGSVVVVFNDNDGAGVTDPEWGVLVDAAPLGTPVATEGVLVVYSLSQDGELAVFSVWRNGVNGAESVPGPWPGLAFGQCEEETYIVESREVCVNTGSEIVEGWLVIQRNASTLVVISTRLENQIGQLLTGTIVECDCDLGPALVPEITGGGYSLAFLGTYFPDKFTAALPGMCDTIQWTLRVWVDGVETVIAGPTWTAPTSFTFDAEGRPIEPIIWLNSSLAPYGVVFAYIPGADPLSDPAPFYTVSMPLPGSAEIEVVIEELLTGPCGAGSAAWGWWNNATTAVVPTATDIGDMLFPSGWAGRLTDPWRDTL